MAPQTRPSTSACRSLRVAQGCWGLMGQPKVVLLWCLLRVIPGRQPAATGPANPRTQPTPSARLAGSQGASGSRGITSARNLALGAGTLWFAQRGSTHFAKRSYADTKRIRCKRGRGTSAASRCMSSIGLNLAGRALAELGPLGWRKRSTGLFASRLSTRCMAPSRHGVLSFNSTCPAALSCTGSPDSAGRVMQRHGCSSRLRSCDSTRTAACRLNPSMAVSKQWPSPSARVRPKRQERPDPTLQYCYCSPALQPARAAQRG